VRKGDHEEKVGGLRMQMERWDRETSDERMTFAPGLLHADSDISIYCFHIHFLFDSEYRVIVANVLRY